MFKKFIQLPLRIYRYIIRLYFIRGFRNFGKSAAGNGCIFQFKKYISIGDDSWIGNKSEIIAYNRADTDSGLTIGDHVRITSRARITCAGNIIIENDVLIAPDVFITDHNHGMNPEIPGGYSQQELIIKPVVIEDGVWLGQRVCVLPGVTIGAHSIIGANSVVTHDIPPYSIAVGSPAKVVKRWNFENKEWENIK